MAAKNAKAVALILGRLGKPAEGEAAPEEAPAEESTGEMDEGLLTAADEAMAAMRSGDSRTFAAAMKHFVQMCGATEYPEE